MKITDKNQVVEMLCDDEQIDRIPVIGINYKNGYSVEIVKNSYSVVVYEDESMLRIIDLEKVICDLCFNGGLTLYGVTFEFVDCTY